MNKRKPDLIWVLTLVFGLGIVTTGYAQGFWERKLDESYQTRVEPPQQQR